MWSGLTRLETYKEPPVPVGDPSTANQLEEVFVMVLVLTDMKKVGSAGSRLTEHFHILGISRNIQCQILRIVSQFYIYNWNMVQSQDI